MTPRYGMVVASTDTGTHTMTKRRIMLLRSDGIARSGLLKGAQQWLGVELSGYGVSEEDGFVRVVFPPTHSWQVVEE